MLHRSDGSCFNSYYFRSTLSRSWIKTLFERFKSYLELDVQKLNPKDTPKLIISPKSIHKLGATGYDIIILDEFEVKS